MTEPGAHLPRSAALQLFLPCQLSEVRPAAVTMAAFLEEQGASTDEKSACELALVEACNNAVQYATPTGLSLPVTVEVLCDSSAIRLHIRDHTPGFAWPQVIELPDPAQERGRGLFLIQSLMDDARYFRGAGSNWMLLEKKRASPRLEQDGTMEPTVDQLRHQLRESEQIVSDMAEELSFCYESLSAIFRCSAELGRSHKLREFSQRLLTDLVQITSANWFVVRLLSRDGSQLAVFTTSDPGLKLAPVGLQERTGKPPLELKAVLDRQDVWFDADTVIPPEDPLQTVPPGSSGLVHPFFLGEQLIGTVAIGKPSGRPHFTAVHANVIHTFTDFLGIQIANARFQEEQVRARLVSRELEIAKAIQRSLLPKSLPEIPGFQLAGFCESAQQVGGDFYDVLKFDQDSLLLIVADVMGKGMPAAMFAAILRSLLRSVPEWASQPGQLLSRVNRLLFQELSGVDMFITAQLVFVNTAERRLVAASAGHCPLLMATTENGSPIKVLSPEGMPLGILPDTTFGVEEASLDQSARILLYTDGLTEARSPDGEFFGHDRLVSWFQNRGRRAQSAEALKSELAEELGVFQGAAAIQDDQTFLIMA